MLSISGLCKQYHPTAVRAVDDFQIEVPSGELVTLVGPSGCGKSTLLRLIAGLLAPDAGKIELAGRDLAKVPPHARDIAMVFQGDSLYPHLSVYENLAFPLRMEKRSREERDQLVTQMATLLRIESLLLRMPATLSGGERQRVAVGRALIRRPKLFLLDEPLAHIDHHQRRQLQSELLRLRQTWPTTTLWVTHDPAEAMRLGDRLAVMHRGKIAQIGPPERLLHEPRHRFVAEFLADPPMSFLQGRMSEVNGQLTFSTGGWQIAIPKEGLPHLPRSGTEFTLGIPASAWQLISADEDPRSSPFPQWTITARSVAALNTLARDGQASGPDPIGKREWIVETEPESPFRQPFPILVDSRIPWARQATLTLKLDPSQLLFFGDDC